MKESIKASVLKRWELNLHEIDVNGSLYINSCYLQAGVQSVSALVQQWFLGVPSIRVLDSNNIGEKKVPPESFLIK